MESRKQRGYYDRRQESAASGGGVGTLVEGDSYGRGSAIGNANCTTPGSKTFAFTAGSDGGNSATETVNPRHFIAAWSMIHPPCRVGEGAARVESTSVSLWQTPLPFEQQLTFFEQQDWGRLSDGFAAHSCTLSSRAAATTNAGGVTPTRWAQASFSSGVKQQQSRQHDSASLQPHG
jgi:hypothetical protein